MKFGIFSKNGLRQARRFITFRRILLFVVLTAVLIWFFNWRRNLGVQTVINGTVEGFESGDPVMATAYLSDQYHDEYGYTRSDIVDIVKELLRELEAINITIENREIEFRGPEASVDIRFKVVATYGPQRGYLAGSPQEAASVRIDLVRESEGWRVVKAGRLRNTMDKREHSPPGKEGSDER